MANENELLKIQREILRYSIQQTTYLRAILEQQAELLAIQKGLPDPETASQLAVIGAQEAAQADEQGLRMISGIDLR